MLNVRRERPRPRPIVINADDFGFSTEVNGAIVRAFEEGLISSATIMANMGGFDEACALVGHHGLQENVGLHLNMTFGRPLTFAAAECSTLCDANGKFFPRRRLLWLPGPVADRLEAEFEAQYQACLTNGVRPTHFDSHHDMHMQLAVTPIVVRIALRTGVTAVRVASPGLAIKDVLRRPSMLPHNLLLAAHIRRLRKAGLAKTRYFGSCNEIVGILGKTVGACEVMVHPHINANGDLVDHDDVVSMLRPQVSMLVKSNSLISYAELSRANGIEDRL